MFNVAISQYPGSEVIGIDLNFTQPERYDGE